MEEKWIRAKELAAQWGITPRRVNQLCASGMLHGVHKSGKFWMIPIDIEKPENLRQYQERRLKTYHERLHAVLPCPVGITSYKEIAEECYYVDKTMLIKDLLDDHSKVYLFTRPRRFGKTLAMDMLKTYFEATDEDTSIYFRDKLIWNCDAYCTDLQGHFPVIYLSFKDAHQSDWQTMYECLCFILREEFLRHKELADSEFLTVYDKQYYKRILNQDASTMDYQFALGKLCSMLAAHYRQKVIILIDEYDTPIQQGYLHQYYDDVVHFMRNLFSSALKDNEKLEFGVLTGILRIAKESLFSGLNNLVVNTILDEKYAGYFGFTKEEVSIMADYYGKQEKISEIREWYDGYVFGSQKIYNPWSVINYFNNDCKPKAFWSRTSGNDIIRQLIRSADKEISESLTRLMQGEYVEACIDTDIIYPDIADHPDHIYSFLVVSGYLRIKDIVSEFDDNPICTLAIPNREIKSVFKKEIVNQITNYLPGSVLRGFETALRTGDTEQITSILETYLIQSASNFDIYGENFYQGVVLGMIAIMSDFYYIYSNREAGLGRFDIQLEPKDHTWQGYIIELKHKKNISNDQLLNLAEKAIEQIKIKKYYIDMEYHGIHQIGLFGIAFSGKNVSCKYEQLAAG